MWNVHGPGESSLFCLQADMLQFALDKTMCPLAVVVSETAETQSSKRFEVFQRLKGIRDV